MIYIDNLEYQITSGMLQSLYLLRMHNPEGYADNVTMNPYGPFYYYYHKDHLSNNREVWKAAYSINGTEPPAGIVQQTSYYPSGLPWSDGMGKSVQPYKYNGKEFVEMHGYDTYDYGARGYYAASGRFTSVDPLAEMKPWHSPYAYCSNNPVNRTDPTGLYDLPEVTVTAPAPNNNNNFNFGFQQLLDEANRNTPQIPRITPPTPSFNLPKNPNANSIVINNKDPKKDNSTLQNISDALAAIGISGNAVEIVVAKSGGEQIVYVTLKGATAIANAAKVSSVLKDIGGYTFYLGAILDVAKAANGEQSWLKAGFSIGVARTAMKVGGWPGFVIGGGYILLDKLGAFDGAPANLPDYQRPITPIDATKTVIPNYSH